MMTENRNGLVVNTQLTFAAGTAERAGVATASKIPGGGKRVTLRATSEATQLGLMQALRDLYVTPHLAPALQRAQQRHRGMDNWS